MAQAPLALSRTDAAGAGAAHQHTNLGVLDQAHALFQSAAGKRVRGRAGNPAVMQSGGRGLRQLRQIGRGAAGAAVGQVKRAGQPFGDADAAGEAAMRRHAQAGMACELVPDQVAGAAGGGVAGEEIERGRHGRDVQR
ncbi:hypothetical protein D3C72_1968780 [compost metagenome]